MVDVVQRQFDRIAYVTGVVAQGAATVSEITMTARNANGAPIPNAIFDLFLSDSAVGNGYSATTASGAVTVKTASTLGNVLFTYLAKFKLEVQTNSAGVFTLSITDSAKTAFKLCVKLDGMTMVVNTLATASYGP
jgi:hypothetical protein